MKHISIRVPWHDNNWNGSVCCNPEGNPFCMALHNIATKKNVQEEQTVAGKVWSELAPKSIPPCMGENGSFMNNKACQRTHRHVYSSGPHAALLPTEVEIPPYSIQGVPFRYMVTASRAHAVRYFMAIKAYCELQGYNDVHPLVAFSGKVLYQDHEYTETAMNSTPDYKISEAGLPLFFASDLYNVLVVADKYQTGFDEPLLHTMFVDKKLRDVKAVQTLSRLNRAHPDKVDTYVLDFVNDPEDIKKSFEPFYTGTELIKPMDLNSVFTLRDNIRELNLWTDQDEQRVEDIVKTVRKDDPTRLGKLSNAFKGVVDRINQLDEETFYTVRGQIKQFVRFYNYLAQVERTYNRDLYRTYVFCDLLLKLIKTKHQARTLFRLILIGGIVIK